MKDQSHPLAERLRQLGYGTWHAPDDFATRVVAQHQARAARPTQVPARRALRLTTAVIALSVCATAIAAYVADGVFHFDFGTADGGVIASQTNDESGKPLVPDPTWKPDQPVRNIADVFATFDKGVQEGRYTVKTTQGKLKTIGVDAPDGSAGITSPDDQEHTVDFYTFRKSEGGAFVGRIAAEPGTRVWLGALWAR